MDHCIANCKIVTNNGRSTNCKIVLAQLVLLALPVLLVLLAMVVPLALPAMVDDSWSSLCWISAVLQLPPVGAAEWESNL